MTAARLRTATITDVSSLQALTPGWRRLFERTKQATPFQSPAWILTWVSTFAPETLCVFAALDGLTLVGLAPFYVHRDPATGARQLTLAGNGVSDHLDLLAAPEQQKPVTDALSAWLEDLADWDSVDFRDVPAGSPLLTLPLPAADERIEPEEPCPVAELPALREEVTARLEKKRRYDLRHGAKGLQSMGEVAFEQARDEAARSAMFEALVELHQQRWSERGEAGIFADARDRAFHEAASRALLEAGLLRLYVLNVRDRTIAAHYALRTGDRGYSYIHAFDPEFAACHPGALLTAHVLEEAVHEGARTFDFLRGREPYKYRWSAVDQPKHRRRAWR